MQLPAEKEESQMFRPNSTWWLSSTFHVVVSFAFVTCFAALGPLACDLVSWRNLIPYPLWSRNSVFSGINLKTPYLANTGLHLTSLAIQIQKFLLPCPPRVPRRAAESEAGWLAQVGSMATDIRVSLTFGVVHASPSNASRALDWSMPQSRRWPFLVKKY